MRESPNGMASASQADSRGFDSRLPLHVKRSESIVAFRPFFLKANLEKFAELYDRNNREYRRKFWGFAERL